MTWFVKHTILFGVVVMNASVKSQREREGEYIIVFVSDTLQKLWDKTPL